MLLRFAVKSLAEELRLLVALCAGRWRGVLAYGLLQSAPSVQLYRSGVFRTNCG